MTADLPGAGVFLGVWLALAAAMAILWEAQRRTRNAGIVDVAWSFGTAAAGVTFAAAANGWGPRRALVAAIVGVWGVRLGTHLLRRVVGEREDVRYRRMREEWGARTQPLLFGFFQLQALWAVGFAAPVAAAAANPRPGFGAADLVGVVLAVIAIGGESVADRQLARFRRVPENRGRVCRDGLWGWSRHPNYFFEWIGWWAYPAFAWGAASAPLAGIGPLVMLWFLLKVTGIPPTEARLLESRGEAYREYQRTTSAFFPRPPARPPARPPEAGS